MTGSRYADLKRPPLREVSLRRALVGPGSLWTSLRVVAETGSTNADLVEAALAGAAEGTVLVAERQVAGRGRLGRVWQSPARAGLNVSVLLRPAQPRPGWPAVPATRLGWLPLLAGVALVQAVRRVAVVDAALKWPNDLLIGDQKCAGLLAEGVGGTDPAVVVGIGLNVTLGLGELPHPAATSLALSGAEYADRAPLLSGLLRDLADQYARWRAAAGDPVASGLRQRYREHCATLGTQVRVSLPDGETLFGRAENVDLDGRLVVVDRTGTSRALAAGDVTHVRKAPIA